MSLMWRKYHIYLHVFPPRILSKKTKKTVFPSEFPRGRCYFLLKQWGQLPAKEGHLPLPGKPRVKMTAWKSQAPALGWNLSRVPAITHCSAHSSCLSPLPHHKRVGVPSGRFTASLLLSLCFPPTFPSKNLSTLCLMFLSGDQRQSNLKTKIQWINNKVLLYSTGN